MSGVNNSGFLFVCLFVFFCFCFFVFENEHVHIKINSVKQKLTTGGWVKGMVVSFKLHLTCSILY